MLACAAGFNELEPVAGWGSASFVGDDLHNVTGFERGRERHDFIVYFLSAVEEILNY